MFPAAMSPTTGLSTLQGRSCSPGLEAQGGRPLWNTETAEFVARLNPTEVESGKRSDRPRLAEALKAFSLQGAKLDNRQAGPLARQRCLHFQLDGVEGRIRSSAFPEANRLTSPCMFIAEHEAKMIFPPRCAALAAAKARGKR